MADEFDSLFREVGLPWLEEIYSETVTRYPLGRLPNGAAIAIVSWNELDAESDTSRGRDVGRHGVLVVPATQAVDARDSYLIRGEHWQMVRFEREPTGTIALHLTRNEPELRTAASKNLI